MACIGLPVLLLVMDPLVLYKFWIAMRKWLIYTLSLVL
ncbi:hypothetical protein F383_09023 [Gossypium arboreum]|uniref:Uncharacterized protein n=1 Tax=Gossypium arboreum TaxID=29729 RepID=A0A0B0NLN9_GOSAR|nr:hypothetical protein F383_09023 [Gossypium arboreum]